MRAGAGRPVIVVGGGIAGLATALALQQEGWPVRVLERGTSLDRSGAGLVLSPNAQRCLTALGLAEEVRSRATVLTRSAVRRPSGRTLARIDLDASGPLLGVVRADLVEVLAAALRPGVLSVGHEVGDVAGLDADLVVGADGLRSVVRTAMGSTVQPTYRGYTAWRALVPLRSDQSEQSDPATLSETWGRGTRFGVVPVAREWTYIYACANVPAGQQSADDLAELRRRFAGWHAPIPELLTAIEPGALLRHDVHDLPPGVTPLQRGRYALVGDAGHAMEPNLGQGAGLALEDAVVLARALVDQPSIASALDRYARERTPRVIALGRQSRRVGRLAQQSHPAVAALRDLSLLMSPDGLARRASGRAVNWQPPTPSRPTPEEIR